MADFSPINYAIDVQSPFQAALQGYQVGATIQQADQQQQAAQAMQADLNAASRNPSLVPGLMVKYPQLADKLKQGWDAMNTTQQQNSLSHAGEVFSAVSSGRPDIAVTALRKRADAMKASGDERGAQTALDMAQWAETDPDTFKGALALRLAAIPGGDKVLKAVTDMGAESRAAAKAPVEQRTAEAEATIKEAAAAVAPQVARAGLEKTVWDNANTRSQIEERSGRLNLDRDKLTSEVQLKLTELNQKNTTLDGDARKLVNDNAVQAVASEQSATQMLDLASRLEQSGATAGVAAKGAELYKKLTGNQDGITQLRQEYTRLRSTQVSKMLPPGPASDKDIQLALSGFPADTADAGTMAAFVRGMAKLQQYDAALSNAKAEWVNAVGHLGKPKTDIEVDGVKVPAGATFVDFARQFVQKKADALAATQGQAQIQSRSYMRFATPQAGQ